MSKERIKLDRVILAIDAGGTYFKSALVNIRGEILDGSFYQAPVSSDGTKNAIFKTYADIIRHGFEYAGKYNGQIMGIGVSTPGPFDYKHGVSLMKHKFQSIAGVPIREELYASGICPDKMPVIFMHDAHAFLAGEHWAGAARGFDNAASITLGTGLGFGIMKNGEILGNAQGGSVESIFKLPYKNGILEDCVSRRGIISRYWECAEKSEAEIDVHEIAEQARSGDETAIKVFVETGRILAKELAGIITRYKIQAVVFGGQISNSFDLFGPAFSRELIRKRIDIAAMSGKNISLSALIGTAENCLRQILHDLEN